MFPMIFDSEEDKRLHDDDYCQAILDEQRKHEETIVNENNY